MLKNTTILSFTKMHSLGNDFVIIDNLKQSLSLTRAFIIALTNRHLGIGCDQLLVLEISHRADYCCRIFNTDGSEAKQCGNGLRCIAYFLQQKNILNKAKLTVETLGGISTLIIPDETNQNIAIQLPTPLLKNKMNDLHIVDLGNKHLILNTALNALNIEESLNAINQICPDHDANIGFMEILNNQKIKLRTFERGVGETLSCGSNACAAAAVGVQNGWLQSPVEVEFKHGSLTVEWPNLQAPIYLMGPTTVVYDGQFHLQQ